MLQQVQGGDSHIPTGSGPFVAAVLLEMISEVRLFCDIILWSIYANLIFVLHFTVFHVYFIVSYCIFYLIESNDRLQLFDCDMFNSNCDIKRL